MKSEIYNRILGMQASRRDLLRGAAALGVNRRSNGTPFWALSASNRDPLAALGFGLRDHQG